MFQLLYPIVTSMQLVELCYTCVQPEVSKYSGELLPLLFACLSKSSQSDTAQRPRDVVRVYYAMETFCENLGMLSTLLLTYFICFMTCIPIHNI